MKKIIFIIILTIFSLISQSSASIYYYEKIGLFNGPCITPFCYENSNLDVNLALSHNTLSSFVDEDNLISYTITGADIEDAILSISSSNNDIIDENDVILNTTNKTISINSVAIKNTGSAIISLIAKDSEGKEIDQDTINITINAPLENNILTLWTVTDGETVSFPFNNSMFNKRYDGTIDWGDGNTETFTNVTIQSLSHTYENSGTYEIKIDGEFCEETNFSFMFFNETIPSGFDISKWNISKVTNLELLFYLANLPENFDISNWDTSNVTTMSGMLSGTQIPSGFVINSWDTSNVTNMSSMLSGTTLLYGLNISGWDVSNVTELSSFAQFSITGDIIYNSTVSSNKYSKLLQLLADSDSHLPDSTTNQRIIAGDNACDATDPFCILSRNILIDKGWIVEDLTTVSEIAIDESTALKSIWTISASGTEITFPVGYYFFSGNIIVDWGDGSSIESFSSLQEASHTYSEIGAYAMLMNGNWGTSLSQMFNYKTIPDNLDISNWNVSNITNMSGMFSNANLPENFDISYWDVGNVLNMSNMFAYNWDFPRSSLPSSLEISAWNTSSVTDMSGMFEGAIIPSGFDIRSWDTSNVTNMSNMFAVTTIPEGFSISSWDTSSVANMSGMFYSTSIPSYMSINSWNTSNVTDMGSMFWASTLQPDFEISSWSTSNVTDMHQMFYQVAIPSGFDISSWDTSSVENLYSTFSYATIPSGFDINSWDVSNVTVVNYLFGNATVPSGFNVDSWDLSADTTYMFYNTIYK